MSKETVLIVDDDKGIARGASLRLEAAGYRTLTANDGAAGVAMALAHKPDAVLLDVRMPQMDGLAALKVLREDERTRDTPVIILSASLRDKQKALDAGARYFLTKPYRSDDVLAALDVVMTQRTPQ